MGFNYKKISAIGSGLLLAGMSIALPVAAANYPAPFVQGGAANVAIVYGTGAGVSVLDAVEAGNIQSDLQARMSTKSTGTSASISGEAVALFTGGTKLYINDTLNTVKTTITKADMPSALKDETFSGNVDATVTQTIQVGPNPRITFERQPTSSDDPIYGLKTSTTNTLPMFNLTATFNKDVNFTSPDSEGTSFSLFGMDLTVGSATDSDTLVLLKSATKIDLSSDAPTQDVTIGGATYTVELVSASDTSATVAVTNSAGVRESKEVDEAASKKINGLTVAVVTADETNLKLSASVVAGADKLTLEDGASVTIGEDDTVVDGTTVNFNGRTPANLTRLVISFDAPGSDTDSVNVGTSYTDPVFGTIKLDFAGVNIPSDSAARENIVIGNSGDDEMQITFNEFRGNEIATTFARNASGSFELVADDDWHNITVREGETLLAGNYVVVGNEDDGVLLKLESTANSSSVGTNSDKAKFIDVATGESIETTWTAEGIGNLNVVGVSYAITMSGDANNASEQRIVRINYPDSTGNALVVYPTIETGLGGNLGFYEPLTINMSGFLGGVNTNVSSLLFPDGDGYTTVTVTSGQLDEYPGFWKFTVGGVGVNVSTNGTGETNTTYIPVGKLMYNITNAGTTNSVKIYLTNPGTNTSIGGSGLAGPGLVLFEEKDDNNDYQALVASLEAGGTSDDGVGVNDVVDTWSNDSSTWESTLKSDSDISMQSNLWGSLVTTDSTTSDQALATISYPDEQVYGEIYLAAADTTISAGTSGGTSVSSLGEVLVKDSEVSSVSTRNLVIVGGSCINSAAATVLGGAYCGQSFTDNTKVGSGEFLIKGVMDKFATGKLALVVAGYNAADTVNAAKYLRTQAVDTSKEYKGTASNSATLVTTTTA